MNQVLKMAGKNRRPGGHCIVHLSDACFLLLGLFILGPEGAPMQLHCSTIYRKGK